MRSSLALVATLVASVAPTARAARPRLRFVSRLWGVGEVHAVDSRGEHLLQRFRDIEAVDGAEVSRDGRFAFVWHHPDHAARRLSFFDLTTMRKTGEIAPGFGGDFVFTPAGHVFHSWGCGTNCAGWNVYDVHGRAVLDGVTSGVELSPDHRFAVTFPSLLAASEPLVLYDLDAGRALVTRQIDRCVDVRWDRDRRLRFATEDAAGHRGGGSIALPP